MDSLDRLFDIFRKERRRYALYALKEAGGPMEIEELAAQITRYEDNGASVSADEFEDVVLSLEHKHLPKAARAEYVEYDRGEGEIEISGSPAEFSVILRASEAVEAPAGAPSFDPDSMTPEEFLSRLSAEQSGN